MNDWASSTTAAFHSDRGGCNVQVRDESKNVITNPCYRPMGPKQQRRKIRKRVVKSKTPSSYREGKGALGGRYIVKVDGRWTAEVSSRGASIAGKLGRIAPVAVRRKALTRK